MSILAWTGIPRYLTTVEDVESQALLEILVDDCTMVEVDGGDLLLSIFEYRVSPA